jgi:septal ring-binding cell division protein DamX
MLFCNQLKEDLEMEIYKDPMIVVYVLAMPLLIIGIAKAWKKIQDKKKAKTETATPQS